MRVALTVLMLAATLAVTAGCDKRTPTAPVVIPPLSAIVLNSATGTLRVGERLQFTVNAFDTTGASIGAVPANWSSTDPTIFSVNGLGRVTGVGEGTALLIAAADTVADSALVTVQPQEDGWFIQFTSSGLEDLNGVYFQPDGRNGWAVGAGGRIFTTHDAGSSWSTQISNTAFTLHAVWFTSMIEGWAVGANGTVLHTLNGGGTWTRRTSGTTETLFDVYFATADSGWAVGTSGLVLRTTNGGATWDKRFPTGFSLRGVSFAGSLDGWAVGDVGTIVGTHNGGNSWFIVQPAVTSQALRGVSRRSEAAAIAVGSQGVTPFTTAGPDSTKWNLSNAGAATALEGVHFPMTLTGYAVGFNGGGAVLRTDDAGATWQTQTANTSARVKDVYFVDANRGWAVCENGVIIHTGTGGTF